MPPAADQHAAFAALVDRLRPLMQALDDARNSQNWDTFTQRHTSDTVLRWPGQALTQGTEDHRREGEQMFKTFLDFCAVVRWGNGQIVEENLVYDLSGMMRQLGLSD